MMSIILFIVLIICLILVAALIVQSLRRRSGRVQIVASFEQLAATMQMESARIQRLPVLALSGRYRTYDLVIECSLKRAEKGRLAQWRVGTALSMPLPFRLFIQGEAHEGMLRKVMDMDVVSTGDPSFDKRIMLFSSDMGAAQKVFTPYLRHRFLWAGFSDFTMELKGTDAIFEIFFDVLTNVRYMRHSLEVWTEFLNILESVL